MSDQIGAALAVLVGLMLTSTAGPERQLPPRQTTRWVTTATTIVATVAAVAAAFVAVWQAGIMRETYELTRQAMIASNRAWVEPSEPRIISGLKPNEPFVYRFKYANIGKEPALNVVIQAYPGTVEPRPPSDLWYVRFPGRNETCGTARPNRNGLVVYPSDTQKRDLTYTSDEPLPDFEAVEKGGKVLVIEGCIGYETFGDAHYSAFCFFLPPVDGKPPDEWPFQLCPTHNHAT